MLLSREARLTIDRPPFGVRAHGRWVGTAASLALIFAAVAVIDPSPASAEVPIVGPIVEGVGSIGHAVLHPADAALGALTTILKAIFGGIEAKLITGVINALLTVPNFNAGNVAALEGTTVALATGMLSAVLTLCIVRYYLVGLSDSGSGGFEALQGVVRVIGAVAFIVLWPGLFRQVVQIPKVFDEALLNSGAVQHNVALLFDAALVGGSGAFAIGSGVGLIFVILIALISAVVFLALLWMKVLLSVLLMFLYVSMPLVVVLWPVPELSWLAAAAMKALLVALIVPCVWAILFALAAAVNTDILTWVPTHGVLDTLIVRPLAGITLMLLCITIPRSLMRTAMVGRYGQGGSRVWRTLTLGTIAARASTGAGRSLAGAAAQGNASAARVIGALPATMRPPSAPGEGGRAAQAFFGSSGYTASDGGKGNAATRPSARTPNDRQGESSEKARGNEGGADAVSRARQSLEIPGIQAPQRDQAQVDDAWTAMQARARLDPPDASAVASAMASFAPQTQRALAAFHARQPQRMRALAAEHVGSPSLTDTQRDALLVMGSAQSEDLHAGIHGALDTLDAQASEHTVVLPGAPSPPSPATRQPAPKLNPGASERPLDSGARSGRPQTTPSGPSRPDARGLPEDPAAPEPFLD